MIPKIRRVRVEFVESALRREGTSSQLMDATVSRRDIPYAAIGRLDSTSVVNFLFQLSSLR